MEGKRGPQNRETVHAAARRLSRPSHSSKSEPTRLTFQHIFWLSKPDIGFHPPPFVLTVICAAAAVQTRVHLPEEDGLPFPRPTRTLFSRWRKDLIFRTYFKFFEELANQPENGCGGSSHSAGSDRAAKRSCSSFRPRYRNSITSLTSFLGT